jgi:hypothetical protein
MRESDDETAVEDIDEAQDTDLESAEDIDEAFEFPFPGLPFPFPFSFGQQRRAPQVARSQRYYSQPPTAYFATQQQLQSVARNIQTDMRRNATAIQTVSRRVDAVQAVTARQNREIVRQGRTIAVQSRQIRANKNAIRQAGEMNLMMFLLTQPTATEALTSDATIENLTIPKDTKFLTRTGTGLDLLLPILMFSGLGNGETSTGSSSSGGGETSAGWMNNNPLLMLLFLQPKIFGG